MCVCVCVCIHVYIYICIYIYSAKLGALFILRVKVQCNGLDSVVSHQGRSFYQQLTKASEIVGLIKVTNIGGLWAREKQITITMPSL